MTRTWARRALLAGFGGGALAGVVDAIATLSASAGILDVSNRIRLIAIDSGLTAAAGGVLALIFLAVILGLERPLARTRVLPARATALILASPLLVHDAFAVFCGVKASRIPGHDLLSAVLILLGAGAILLALSLWGRILTRVEVGSEEKADVGGVRFALIVAIALVVAALAIGRANRVVLPRLYSWFHLSLSAIQLVLWVLVLRLLLGLHRWARDWMVGLVLVGGLAVGLTLGLPALANSQSLRFFVYEKSQLASIIMRYLPMRKTAVALPGASPTAAALPPLPAGPHRPDADIVLITIDAVRADHLGCYGYARPTTPNIDDLAARGVRFEHAYAQAPHTSFSLASLMIGKYYPTLARLAPSDTHETLAKLLRRYGWKTAAFFPPAVFYIDAHKMKAFEANNFDFEYVKYEFLAAEGRVGQIEDFLRVENPRKLFLWLHLFEPHEPYEHHPGFDFGTRDVDRYDSEIAYADSVVGEVVKLIERKRPGAIVVLAADHGEEFGEHGGRYHGTTLFEEQVHVPLIVVVPGLAPHVVVEPTQLIDISATILGLLDIPLPARMRGTDLGPWLVNPPAPAARLPPAFAEVEDKRMVALGLERLICDVGKDYCSYFDVGSDPREQHDLADQRPDRVAILRQHLDGWLGQQARYEAKLLGAAGGVGDLARLIERARLGDAHVASSLAELLDGTAPASTRREAASLLVTALPPRPETLNALRVAATTGGDDEVRDWAAVAATRLGATEAQDRLRAILAKKATEATEMLHVQAALALAEKTDKTGVPVLAEALDSCGGDVPLCKRIVAVLGELKDGRAVHPLVEHLAFVQTRRETVEALATIADPTSVPALVACLKTDEYVPVRVAAAKALGRLGGARSLQALVSALSSEREDLVVAAVRSALAAHGQGR
jgi:arylsulfatase A-like enzyme/HEAT repeat protein